MIALAIVAEAESAAEHHGPPAWLFGLVGFAVLMLALFVVTRFNPNR